MMLEVALLASLVFLGGHTSQLARGDDVGHEISGPDAPRNAPASLNTIQRQLDDADRAIGDRSAARLVVWDAAAAGSQAEHEDIGQGALVLAVATARSAADLPLRRVYVVGPEGKQMDLLLVGTMPLDKLQALRISGKAGTNVWAGVYYFPAARRMARGSIFADFVMRKDFEIGRLPADMFGTLRDREGRIQIYLGNIAQMALREYAGTKLEPDFRRAVSTPNGTASPAQQ